MIACLLSQNIPFYGYWQILFELLNATRQSPGLCIRVKEKVRRRNLHMLINQNRVPIRLKIFKLSKSILSPSVSNSRKQLPQQSTQQE